MPSLRVRVNALDLALYRRLRGVARTPETVRAVRSYSRLGEHSYLWFAIAALGIAAHRRHRPTYLRLGRTVVAAGKYAGKYFS